MAAARADAQARRSVRAVIFDLDGTLLDTEPISLLAMNQALRAIDAAKSCDSALKARIIGLRDVDWARVRALEPVQARS
jgi:beta-phosphoglucomutase-like phosphatase (HAD superfamily)